MENTLYVCCKPTNQIKTKKNEKSDKKTSKRNMTLTFR